MAWRIHDAVVRGEIDNREPGRVTGRIWLQDRVDPLELELEGNPWRDLAGMRLGFENPAPQAGDCEGLVVRQVGKTGDITASRKVKVPDCSTEALMEHIRKRTAFPWHWGNALYLEWYSEANGRVVIESSSYALTLLEGPAWRMSDEEERQQVENNAAHLEGFLSDLSQVMDYAEDLPIDLWEDACEETDEEIEAEAYHERVNTLMDRMQARMDREGIEVDSEAWEAMYEEEKAKMRRERGEPEPEPRTPEEIEAMNRWVDEMNEVLEEEMKDWAENPPPPPEKHPLTASTQALGHRIRKDIQAGGWLPPHASEEHPLQELSLGVSLAAGKLAGALGRAARGEWPPPPYAAGDTLYRLKKARELICDAMMGLRAAEEQNLGVAEWRECISCELSDILQEIQDLITEVRDSLS